MTTILNIPPNDHLRDTVLHAHTDIKVGIKLLRRWRLIKAWKKLNQGCDRLGKALDTRSPGV